ncbi:hypothetical protein EDD15DRAFT_80989 [Pisolithus albus]|nr:hypothetical protein EDD15DRAFT_80989 [Pisolithus albus]
MMMHHVGYLFVILFLCSFSAAAVLNDAANTHSSTPSRRYVSSFDTTEVAKRYNAPSRRDRSHQASRPRQAIPSRQHSPRQAAPSRVHTPRQAAPSRVHTPRQATPSRAHTPRQATPSHVHTPRQAVPSKVHTPRQAVPSRVHTARQADPSLQHKPRQDVSSPKPSPHHPGKRDVSADPDPHVPSPSQALRKRSKVAPQVPMFPSPNVCPAGLSACPIQESGLHLGAENVEYECVDFMTDLDHCGGCSSQDFDRFNCRADPHASSVACVSGGCVTTSCQPGYTLQKGNRLCTPV